MRKKKIEGLTLIEVMVAFGIFMVLTMLLFGTLTNGTSYMKRAYSQVSSQQNCIYILDTIMGELRQGVANPATGSTGYQGISPSVGPNPTAVLYPNRNTKTGNYLLFTEPNYTNYDPFSNSFNPINADNFQQIKYSTSGDTLNRQLQTIASGSLTTAVVAPVAKVSSGTIAISITYLTDTNFDITVTVTEDSGKSSQKVSTASGRVFVSAR